MNIYNLNKVNQSVKLAPAERQTLRAGQIIQGKVLKLYPENKAEIQLGNQKLVANLEVGLEVGSKYHFQVQSTSDVIQLKVINQASTSNGQVDLGRLLQQLGIKESRANIQLVDQLIRLKIPFESSQLAQSVALLKNAKNKPAAIDVLTHMIDRKLPINSSIFSALTEVTRSSITSQLSAVIQQMNTSDGMPLTNNQRQAIEVNLQRLVSTLIDKPQTFQTALSNQVLSQNSSNNQGLFRTLQGLGMLPLNTDFSTWKADWSNVQQNNSLQTGTNQNPLTALPSQLNTQELSQVLSRITEQSAGFTQAVKSFSNQWSQQLNFHQLLNTKLPEQDFAALKSSLTRDILPFIQGSQVSSENALQQITNTPSHLSALYQGMQTLQQGSELENLLKLFQRSISDENFLSMSPRQQFLTQTSLFIQSIGLDYEQQLLQQLNTNNQSESIKGMLLQLANNAEGMQSEANTRLVNLINGMQIQSVNESQTVVQAAIQIPAERLGLIKDIELEFEGKKNENGEINPDYCRILFYLNLGAIKETVIDMNIQQRKVSITIFNNEQGIKDIANLFKNKLEQSLEEIDYQLGSIQYKKIEEKEKTMLPVEQRYNETQKQGVDYRI
ncbi:hypothetical protein [Oceanobacillus sp. CAU 1775]